MDATGRAAVSANQMTSRFIRGVAPLGGERRKRLRRRRTVVSCCLLQSLSSMAPSRCGPLRIGSRKRTGTPVDCLAHANSEGRHAQCDSRGAVNLYSRRKTTLILCTMYFGSGLGHSRILKTTPMVLSALHAPIALELILLAPRGASTCLTANGTDEWCKKMRTFPSSQRWYPKVYSTLDFSPVVAQVK